MTETQRPTTGASLPPRSGLGVPALTAEEALALLTSALQYCQAAGLRVQAANHDGRLVLGILGAKLDGPRIVPAEAVTA